MRTVRRLSWFLLKLAFRFAVITGTISASRSSFAEVGRDVAGETGLVAVNKM